MGATREIKVIVGFRLTSEYLIQEEVLEEVRHSCDNLKKCGSINGFKYCPFCGALMVVQRAKTKKTFAKGFSAKKFTADDEAFDLYHPDNDDDDTFIVLQEVHTYNTDNSLLFIPLDDKLIWDRKNKVRKSLDESGVGNYYGVFVLSSVSY